MSLLLGVTRPLSTQPTKSDTIMFVWPPTDQKLTVGKYQVSFHSDGTGGYSVILRKLVSRKKTPNLAAVTWNLPSGRGVSVNLSVYEAFGKTSVSLSGRTADELLSPILVVD